MPGALKQISSFDPVGHVIQVALVPIFLLSGIATLLNVFSTRLARVADRGDQIRDDRSAAGSEDELNDGVRAHRLWGSVTGRCCPNLKQRRAAAAPQSPPRRSR
jgi:hypothetical protein